MILLFTFFFNLWACDGGLVKGQWLERSVDLKSGVASKELFLKVIKDFEKVYAPFVEKVFDRELIIYKSWESSTLNAYAEQSEKKWMITLYGGLARFESITPDGLSLVLCHELAHHMGGAPKKNTNKWSSAEGQADYFATMKCLKKLWAAESPKEIEALPSIVKDECAKSYAEKRDQYLCERSAMAGKSVALLFQYLDRESFEPEFHTPDQEVVRFTQLMHPYAQCRLDTYFHGSLCARSPDELMDDHDERQGNCLVQDVSHKNYRPFCWYRPR